MKQYKNEALLKEYAAWRGEEVKIQTDQIVIKFLDSNPESLYGSEAYGATPDSWAALGRALSEREGQSPNYAPDFINPSLESFISSYVGPKAAGKLKTFAIENLGYGKESFAEKPIEWPDHAEVTNHSRASLEGFGSSREEDNRHANVINEYQKWKKEAGNQYLDSLVTGYLDANPDKLYSRQAYGASPSAWSALGHDLSQREGGSSNYSPDPIFKSLESFVSAYIGPEAAEHVKEYAIKDIGYDEKLFIARDVQWPNDVDHEEARIEDPKIPRKVLSLEDLIRDGVIVIPPVESGSFTQKNLKNDTIDISAEREASLREYKTWAQIHEGKSVDPLISRFLEANPETIRIPGEGFYDGADPSKWSALAHALTQREGGSRNFDPDIVSPSLYLYIESYVGVEAAAQMKAFAIEEMRYPEDSFDDKYDLPVTKVSKHRSDELSVF